MQLIHMSHTDLDGYGCQFITKKIYKDPIFYNANYGLEVKIFLKDALDTIRDNFKDTKVLFLITDLNLTLDESKKLDNDISILKALNYDIELLLLDHHGSGLQCANKFDWYYLDTKRSATKITFDYFCQNNNEFKKSCDDKFTMLIDAINAVDIWLDDEELFEFGKVCLTMVSKSYEINHLIFPKRSRAYKLYLISKALEYVTLENGHIKLDEQIYFIKKDFLNHNKTINTLENISSSYLVNALEDTKENMTIFYNDYKGLLTYGLGSISIPANAFLKANPDFDFFIDISKRGRAGLRADNKLDVSVLAKKLCGGGGHPNASGMAFKDFKEKALYSEVREFMQMKLDNCI